MQLSSKKGLEISEDGNATMNLTFTEQSESGKGRFGVFLHHKDTIIVFLSDMIVMAGFGNTK